MTLLREHLFRQPATTANCRKAVVERTNKQSRDVRTDAQLISCLLLADTRLVGQLECAVISPPYCIDDSREVCTKFGSSAEISPGNSSFTSRNF